MPHPLIQAKIPAFDQTIEHFAAETGKLRTGRAHPGLVESLLVEYYNTETPLKQIASISVPEARQIVIAPWDKGALTQIEAAVRESDLGLSPVNDGSVVRITLPALTEERRRELVKTLGTRAEEARIALRTVREEVWKSLQDLERSGEIGEDEKFHGKDDLQKLIDDYNAKIEAVREKKEAEIMTV